MSHDRSFGRRAASANFLRREALIAGGADRVRAASAHGSPARWTLSGSSRPHSGLDSSAVSLFCYSISARCCRVGCTLALAAFVTGFGFALVRAVRQVRMPDERTAGRRIETETALAHRPVTTRDDNMVGGFGDRGSALLWEAHQRQREAALAKLRVGVPKAGLARRDPLGLRAALILLLLVGFVAARDDLGSRIARGLVPDFTGAGTATPVAYDIWITPPAYTRLPPVLLSTNSAPDAQPHAHRTRGESSSRSPAKANR
jgi:hypothetical protein